MGGFAISCYEYVPVIVKVQEDEKHQRTMVLGGRSHYIPGYAHRCDRYSKLLSPTLRKLGMMLEEAEFHFDPSLWD